MFSRFWKDESRNRPEVEAVEDQAIQARDDADAKNVGELPSEADSLSSEEVLQQLAAESDPPIAPDEPDAEPEEPLPGESLLPASRPRRRKTRLMVDPEEVARQSFTPQQRLLLLDTWQRSGLPAKDFAALVGVSSYTLYKWRRLFEQSGPEGLIDQRRRSRQGSRLPEVTKRTILMLKRAHPEWGCQRISDALLRGPAMSASATAVARVLREAGYETVGEPTRPHPQKARTFERARPNQLWQTDLFTFMLKRQNRRLYLVAFLDDHSRFVVSYGLHASASTALVIEALEAGIANYGVPEEILTDNGPQYVTWRGKSRFTKQLEKRGIRQIVARPKRPQTLGKVERFWGTLWRELLEAAVFVDLADARERIGHFLDYYNFQRTHTGIDGLVPADRFFGAAEEVRRTLAERVAANALELARAGHPKSPFYVTGQVSGQSFSVHSQGERLVLSREGQPREEIELTEAPAEEAATPPDPICPHRSAEPEAEDASEAPSSEPGEARLNEDAESSEEEGDAS